MSVIVPVFNVGKYLSRCIDSVLKQKRTDVKIILIDDGSTDNSSAICDEYEMNFSNVQTLHKQNGGISSARNQGIDHAEGEYLCFVDPDDSLAANFFDEVIPCLKKDNLDILGFKYSYEKEYGCYSLNGTKEYELVSQKQYISDLLTNKFGCHIWSRIYNRKLFRDIRFPEGRNYEDIAIFYKLLLKSNRIASINYQYYIYNLSRNDTITKSVSRKNMEDMYWAVGEMCEAIQPYCESVGIDPKYCEYYRRNTYIYIFFKLIQSNEDTDDFREKLKAYLKQNHKYNLWKYRHYDLRKLFVFKILNVLKIV